MNKKPLKDLTIEDISKHAVWEMTEEGRSSDVFVKPVKKLPVETMNNRLVATKIQLADGSEIWALLGNIKPLNSQSTKHFLTVSIESEGKWFDLARYHDADHARRDGHALAKFLGKRLAAVFPIAYNISEVARGQRDSLVGTIESAPKERLSSDELIQLALQPD